MTARREWATVAEHVASTLHPSASPVSSQLEEPVSSPVTAALGAVQQQAVLLEQDTLSNPLPVVLAARHVGRAFSYAECIAIADFLAQLEAEKRGQAQALAAYPEMAPNGHGRLTGPQPSLP